MNKLALLSAALLATTVSAVAQTCATPPAAMTFSNRDEFVASFHFNIGVHFCDITAQRDISISQIRTWTYDQGEGFPPVPSQVGNQGTVNVYTCPVTRLGSEALNPANPGSPWTLLGTGTITIVAMPGESPIVFNPPLALAAGTHGVAIHYLPTTTGMNPGPLHCLGMSPNPGGIVSDQFLQWSNDGIQPTAWTGAAPSSPNLRVVYTADASSAYWKNVGEGCYFRPHAWYENFPPSATPPDVANTAMQWVFTGTQYIVVPSAATYVAPTSPSLTLGPPAYSYVTPANWDDALAAAITLPWTLNFPGGSTNEITISSNGCIYLGNVASSSYNVCGAAYGSIAGFRDEEGRIAAFYHDLDLSSGGTLHYEVVSSAFVRVTWANVPEWQVPTALNTIQVTIHQSGNIQIVYGPLANTHIVNGNNALLGFTPGNGSRLPPPIDISAAMPYTSGDGQVPPILGLHARPVIGTTFDLVTTNLAPGTPFQVLSLGTQLAPFPVDLGFLGMPGCSLHHAFLVLLTVTGPGPDLVAPFSVPPNPSLFNQQLTGQGFPFALGLNPFNLIATNGVCMRIGN
ncbi:MAG TPA: hypothetical protein VFD82_08930 [Planctomycetota bacterium]|nr:hypothetical protein [Planctomycetota bacterium]